MNIVQIVTHQRDGLKRLLSQYKGRPNIEGILKTYLRQIQAIEDVLFTFFDILDPETAVGAQLDLIGNLIDEDRLGQSDDFYRIRIQTRIFILRNNGTIPVVIKVYKAMMQAQQIEYYPEYPAAFRMDAILPGTPLLSLAEISGIILNVIPAGVGILLVIETTLPPFAFDGFPDSEGFGDSGDPDPGGYFVEAILVA